MAKFDYPFRAPDIKFGTNLVVNVILIVIVLGYYVIMGLICLIIGLVNLCNAKKSYKTVTKKAENYSERRAGEKRRWLLLIDDRACDYAKCFEERGCIYINIKRRKPNISDTFYLYTAKGKRVRFKTKVVAIDVPREDQEYWRVEYPEGLTCKLKLIAEYKGWALCASNMGLKGFDGAESIKFPIFHNKELLDYIEEHFNNPNDIIVKSVNECSNPNTLEIPLTLDGDATHAYGANEQNVAPKVRKNRRWLVLADDNIFDYEKSFDEHGYIYLNTKNRRFERYDTVYLYMATNKRVKYETLVMDVDVPRQDKEYWKISPPEGLTCKLQRTAEYNGRELCSSKLKEYGFNGEQSIKLPISNNTELLDYLEDFFVELYHNS